MFVVVREMIVLDNLFYLMLAVIVVHLVRKIAREHERLVTHGVDQMMQRLFRLFATDIYSPRLDVAADVCAHGFSLSQLDVFSARIVLDMFFPATAEPFKTCLQPG